MRKPGDTIEKYRLDSLLGRGGFSDVWKAWDTELNRWVALKFLTGSDPDELARFRREARTAARLNHPHIAAIYEARDTFIAMQFIDGQTLAAMPDRRALVELVAQAADAVHFAHEAGIIHRDLKPANLMVAGTHVYVMDFGLAKSAAVDASLSVSGTVLGTPAYMPPEQARGDVRSIGPASDVYALGATLYELLAGRPPFTGATIYEIIRRVIEGDTFPPSHAIPTIDRDLDTIVMKCLEKDPVRRYRSARELAADLRRWIHGEPIAARPISTLERIRRRLARSRAITAMAAVLVVVLVASGVVLGVQRSRATAEREKRVKAVQELSALWTTIVDRKRELRLQRAPDARERLESAVRAVDAHIEAWRDLPQGWYVRARGRLYLGDLVGAEQDAKAAIAVAPDFRPGWSLIGAISMERYQQSLVGSVRGFLARLTAAQSLLKDAEGAFAKGWVKGQEEADSLTWGLPWMREDEVMSTVAQALQLFAYENRKADAVKLLDDGMKRYQAEEYAYWLGALSMSPTTRRRCLDLAITWGPGLPDAWFARGSANRADGRFKEAVADYTRFLDLKGPTAAGYAARALARQDAEDLDGAVADFEKAMQLDPKMPEAWDGRGTVRLGRSDLAGALDDFEHAMTLDPTYAMPFYNRARVRELKSDFRGALEDYTKCIELDERHVHALGSRGRLRAQLRDFDNAVVDLKRAIEIDPTLLAPHSTLALVAQTQGQWRLAADEWTAALEIRPNEPLFNYNRGTAFIKLREYVRALEDFEVVVAEKPDFPDGWANRGLTKGYLGRFKEAIPDLEKALKIAPANWAYRRECVEWIRQARERAGE